MNYVDGFNYYPERCPNCELVISKKKAHKWAYDIALCLHPVVSCFYVDDHSVENQTVVRFHLEENAVTPANVLLTQIMKKTYVLN